MRLIHWFKTVTLQYVRCSFIHLLNGFILERIRGVLGPIPATFQIKVGDILDVSPVHHRADRNKQLITLTFTPCEILSIINEFQSPSSSDFDHTKLRRHRDKHIHLSIIILTKHNRAHPFLHYIPHNRWNFYIVCMLFKKTVMSMISWSNNKVKILTTAAYVNTTRKQF